MGPENRFIAAVHKQLDKRVHREKMHNPYRGGTADVWYSGGRADCWIEYKHIARIPRTGKVVPDLSPLQKQWLKERYKEGRTVFVVVGCPDGGVFFPTPDAWENGVTVDVFKRALLKRPVVAEWIARQTLGAEGETEDAGNKETGRPSVRRD